MPDADGARIGQVFSACYRIIFNPNPSDGQLMTDSLNPRMPDGPSKNGSQLLVPASYSEPEFDLDALVRRLWGGKWLIGIITMVFTVAAVVGALLLPDQYRSETLLAPAIQEQQSMISSLASQFGGLSGLAGIDLDKGSISKVDVALATVKSRQFLTSFARRHELVVPLLASTGWNETTGEWMIDEDVYNTQTETWVQDTEGDESPRPTDWEIVKAMRNIIGVDEDTQTGLVTISLEFYSPSAVKEWTQKLISDLNAAMRAREITDLNRNIGYLEDQIQKTDLSATRNALARLIESQAQRLMVAESRPEYILKTIDPPVAPEEPSAPNRRLIVIFGAFLGMVVGSILVLVVFLPSQSKIRTPATMSTSGEGNTDNAQASN
jgi:LPS O-antigen subunit length determinant protein (WzzB/FepE family)